MSRSSKQINNVKYGICTNMDRKPDGTMCTLCQRKEKQAIRSTKDFVCAECGAPLTEVTPPKPKLPKMVVIIVVVIVFLLAAAVAFGVFKPKNGEIEKDPRETISPIDTTKATERDTVYITDTSFVVIHDTIIDTVLIKGTPSDNFGKAPSTDVKNGTYSLGWGTYSGPMKKGKPEDGVFGEIKVIKEYRIDLKDGRGGTLDVKRGDLIVNPKFKDGKWMIQGELHRTDGTRRVL